MKSLFHGGFFSWVNCLVSRKLMLLFLDAPNEMRCFSVVRKVTVQKLKGLFSFEVIYHIEICRGTVFIINNISRLGLVKVITLEVVTS